MQLHNLCSSFFGLSMWSYCSLAKPVDIIIVSICVYVDIRVHGIAARRNLVV